jgi:hypothetical protein
MAAHGALLQLLARAPYTTAFTLLSWARWAQRALVNAPALV